MAREGGEPDFYAPMGSALPILRKSLTDFPREAFLRSDPAKRALFRERLAQLGDLPRRHRLLGQLLGVEVDPPKRGRPWGKPDISHGAQQPPDC